MLTAALCNVLIFPALLLSFIKLLVILNEAAELKLLEETFRHEKNPREMFFKCLNRNC